MTQLIKVVRHKSPSLIQKMINVSKAIVTEIRAPKPFNIVPDNVYQFRMSTCMACPHWEPSGNVGFGKCLLCGCCRSIKHKLANQECPDDPPRWTAYKG